MVKLRGAGVHSAQRGDVGYKVVVYSILWLALLVVLLPLLHIVASSFSSPTAVASGAVFLWPVEPSLKGYAVVFSSRRIGTGFLNSFIYSTVGTAINIVMTVIAAYPLSRRDFFGRNVFMFAFTFTMIFYGGLIPTYLVVRTLGMVNTRLAMVIPNAMAVFYVIITRTYFQSTLPGELREAAEIDGCDDFTFVWSVVLPFVAAHRGGAGR